jgi:hypothetical protein
MSSIKKNCLLLMAGRLDPIKTRKTYVNSKEKFLKSQFCNFSEEEETSLMGLYG